jgi:gas vesicle protein GvpL/GvpF
VQPAAARSLRLYAVVPAEDARALAGRRGFSVLACGTVAALFGWPPDRDPVALACRYDRIVRLAFATCSSVVPFRLGVDLGSEGELRDVMSRNASALAAQLGRFRGRVEMGLKAGLSAPAAGRPLGLPAGLDRVRALAPAAADRRERMGPGAHGRIFEGCYLISRRAVEDFWRAVEGIRRRAPDLPLLGSGPWAAYSFCDAPLRGARPTRSTLRSL